MRKSQYFDRITNSIHSWPNNGLQADGLKPKLYQCFVYHLGKARFQWLIREVMIVPHRFEARCL